MDRRHFVRGGLLAGSALGAGVLAGCGGWPLRPAQATSGPGAPVAADGALRRIALGSCTDESKPQPIWNTVLADRPDLVIFGGDNVYSSAQPWSLAALEQAYEAQAAVQPFARLRQAVRHMAIWDDHDYGLNDGGVEFPHKQASKEAFLRFWKVPATDPRHGREGIYHAETFGPPLMPSWRDNPLRKSRSPVLGATSSGNRGTNPTTDGSSVFLPVFASSPKLGFIGILAPFDSR